jgi:hypothetical protein
MILLCCICWVLGEFADKLCAAVAFAQPAILPMLETNKQHALLLLLLPLLLLFCAGC